MKFFNNKLGIWYYDVEETCVIIEKIIKNNGLVVDGNHMAKYLNIVCTFDIEDTNFTDKDNNKLALLYHWQLGLLDKSTGYVYCICGRTEEEFEIFIETIKMILDDANKDSKTHIYFLIFVHNLSHEYFFIKHIMCFDEVFVTKSNTILYARSKKYHIEMRCSYFLSGCGLKGLTEIMDEVPNIQKLVGDLDYDKIRTPLTPLTDEEIAYCLNDVRLPAHFISQQFDKYGLKGLQLTKTGVADYNLKQYCMGTPEQKKSYLRYITQLQFHNALELIAATKAFQGGHTMSNPVNTNVIIPNVTCYDFSSSYPSVCICSDEVPVSFINYHEKLDEETFREMHRKGSTFICKFTFINLTAAEYEYENEDGKIEELKVIFDTFMPSSKVEEYEPIDDDDSVNLNNGKIRQAKKVVIYGTYPDFESYDMFYRWDECIIEDAFEYEMGYYPASFRKFILELYRDKTTLKNVKGRELEYNLKKEILNSASYGLQVKSITKDLLKYDEEQKKWRPTITIGQGKCKETKWLDDVYDMKNSDDILAYYDKKVEDYNKQLRRGKFGLSYISAIFISSIARRNLAESIIEAGTKHIFCYSDTDSIYVQDVEKMIDWIENYYNKTYIKGKMEKSMLNMGLDKDYWIPYTTEYTDDDGVVHKPKPKPCGYFDFDGHSKYFKTLGSKRYMKIDDDDHIHATIAGLSKSACENYFVENWGNEDGTVNKEILDHFTPVEWDIEQRKYVGDMVIPAEKTEKLCHTIFNSYHEGTITDFNGVEYNYKIHGGVNLSPVSFALTINDDDYIKLIRDLDDSCEFLFYE